MTTHAQIKETAAAVAGRLGLTYAQVCEYSKAAGEAGFSNALESLATIMLAANDPRGRGPEGADKILAGIYRRSPLRDFDSNARLRAEVNRRCATRGRWQDQVQSGDAPPRGRRGLAEWVMKHEAYRRYPGKSRSAYALRMAWRRGIETRQMELACAE